MAVWGAVMGGVNLLYQGAGWLEGGLTASFEKLILDAEILQMIVRGPPAARGRRGRASAFDAIAEVGPGGHFFGTAHTLERYETAFYRPLVSDWRNFETWQEDGARTATERANRDLEAAPRRVRAAAARPGRRRGARRVRRPPQARDRGRRPDRRGAWRPGRPVTARRPADQVGVELCALRSRVVAVLPEQLGPVRRSRRASRPGGHSGSAPRRSR